MLEEENPKYKEASFEVDSKILQAQTDQIVLLTDSVERLANAVSMRPTKYDVESSQRRLRNQLILTIVGFLFITALLFQDQRVLDRQCVERNNNTSAFRTLIVFLVDRTNEDVETNQALNKYLNTLVPVVC